MANEDSHPDGMNHFTLIALTTAGEIRNVRVDTNGFFLTTPSTSGSEVVSISSIAAGVVVGLSTLVNTISVSTVAGAGLVGLSTRDGNNVVSQGPPAAGDTQALAWPVVLVDGSAGGLSINAAANVADGASGSRSIATSPMVAVSSAIYDRLRTPKVFKPQSIVGLTTAASTLWQGASAGKRPRLMGYNLASLAGSGPVYLCDGVVGTIIHTVVLTTGGAATGVGLDIHSPPMGNGIQCGSTNLVAFSTTVTSIAGTIFGTEE